MFGAGNVGNIVQSYENSSSHFNGTIVLSIKTIKKLFWGDF
jgi:hypothetical protein